MSKSIYTPEMLDFLSSGYKSMNVRNLTSAFNKKFGMSRSIMSIRSVLNRYKIRCGRSGSDRLIEIKTTILTTEQDEFIRTAYKKMSAAKMTETLNAKFGTEFKTSQVSSYCYNHSIKSGRTGHYEKGQKPWNDNTKGLTCRNHKSFKKGNIPANIKPLYAERISKDGVIEIKVPVPCRGKKTSYQAKSRWIWEQNHGPIPEGSIISFKDGDPLNCSPENLMLVSRAELLQLNQNGYRSSHEEIKPSVLLLSKLQVKVREQLRAGSVRAQN